MSPFMPRVLDNNYREHHLGGNVQREAWKYYNGHGTLISLMWEGHR